MHTMHVYIILYIELSLHAHYMYIIGGRMSEPHIDELNDKNSVCCMHLTSSLINLIGQKVFNI